MGIPEVERERLGEVRLKDLRSESRGKEASFVGMS